MRVVPRPPRLTTLVRLMLLAAAELPPKVTLPRRLTTFCTLRAALSA